MSLSVVLQMDPIERIDIDTDSSFALAIEARRRGHDLHCYTPNDLFLHNGNINARIRRLDVRHERGRHYEMDDPRVMDLACFDIILMRQDPPFDMTYIAATHLLEMISGDVCVFNDPVQVRNAPEKLFVTRFPDLMPPTLITADRAEVARFRAQHSDIIIKPLFGCGGASVFHITPDNDNLNALLEMFARLSGEPVIVQKYLPDIRLGDKRIILIDGEPAGAINRLPAAGEARANLHAGGRAEKAELTERDREICARIGPELSRRDLVFAGIDVIGGYLTEINVTSPTGIQEIDRFDNVSLASRLWDVFEERWRRRKV